ncbi:MAG: amidase family protein [Polyangiales bacterium]
MFEDYPKYDAVGLADLIRRKEVAPKEVLEAAILRAETINPSLNAVVVPLYDHALTYIKERVVEGPFAYVPFLLKDVHHALAGTPMSNGSALHRGERSPRSATIVKRWLDAGLVVFGKTNTPEYKLSPATNPRIWGPTRNPWNVTRTPGGSSGGSAAAVAAGIAPLASATDEAGSIRMPAANCGLFGLKPTRGRNPIGPDFRWKLGGFSTSHVISRSVRDSAAALDATSALEPGSPYACEPASGYLDALTEVPVSLRIAISTDAQVLGRRVDAACLDGIRRAGAMLGDFGHHVEDVPLPFDEREVMRLGLILIAANFAEFVDDLAVTYGTRAVVRGLEPINRFIWKAGRAIPADLVQESVARCAAITRAMGEFHRRFDILVTSTQCCPPKRIEEIDPSVTDVRLATLLASPVARPLMSLPGAASKIIDAQLDTLIDRVPYRTTLANLTGQPAMSVPLHVAEGGLPVGIQFFAAVGEDRLLLRLAAQLEEAHPWAGRLPFGLA